MAYQLSYFFYCQIHFYTYKQFYLKQCSLTQGNSLNSKTVLFQTIQFSICTVLVYTWLNVKTVLFQANQFSISKQFQSI